ncbi:MAG TPA: hypothetical protein PKH24_06605, partial [Sedimentisphaerales bacterium]|nr:hypothetical protein [Sedimentisphaerales bacterium]
MGWRRVRLEFRVYAVFTRLKAELPTASILKWRARLPWRVAGILPAIRGQDALDTDLAGPQMKAR